MKRYVYALALTALAGVSFAAIGPGKGLPASWTFSADKGYGTVGIARNGASAMCVECHTANPSQTLMQISDNGALTFDNTITVNGGSHFVINKAADANVYGTTHSGGGHAGSFGDAARDAGEYLRGAPWTNGGNSKFGSGTALTSVTELGVGFAVGTADMICESCHSLVQNVSNGANVTTGDNDLLLGVYLDNQKDGLCTGCHAQDEAATGRQAFHAINNLKNFNGAARKFHHVMTGDTIDPWNDYAGGIDTQRWAPSFSTILGQGWCTTTNKFKSDATSRGTAQTIASPDTTTPTFRDKCNITGTGTLADTVPFTLGDIRITSAANPVNCSNCHRPHNAQTAAGAHIFRLGNNTMSFPGQPAAGDWANDLYKGIRRQADTTGKIYGEYRALCMGCHVGY